MLEVEIKEAGIFNVGKRIRKLSTKRKEGGGKGMSGGSELKMYKI